VDDTVSEALQSWDTSSSKRSAVWIGAIGGVLALAFMLRILSSGGGDPTVFLIIGEDATPIVAYAEELLARPIRTAPNVGHDGRFFFIQALDPWISDPKTYETLMDRPRHRAVRVLYPMLAGGFGFLGPEQVIWAMALVNVLAMAVGSWVTARVAQRMLIPAWSGLAFALNPGMLFEQQIAGAGVVAWAFGMGAVLAIYHHRDWLAGGLLAAAVLCREPMLLELTGLVLWVFVSRRRVAFPLMIPTVAVAGMWFTWVSLRIAPIGNSFGQSLGLPLVGLFEAFQGWLRVDRLGLVMAAAIFSLGVLVVVAAARDRDLLSWATAGFALLALFLTQLVWQQSFDSSRALAPLFTASALLLLRRIRRRTSSAFPQADVA
jgi:hypothetical protein